jgi:hypothetical protein
LRARLPGGVGGRRDLPGQRRRRLFFRRRVDAMMGPSQRVVHEEAKGSGAEGMTGIEHGFGMVEFGWSGMEGRTADARRRSGRWRRFFEHRLLCTEENQLGGGEGKKSASWERGRACRNCSREHPRRRRGWRRALLAFLGLHRQSLTRMGRKRKNDSDRVLGLIWWHSRVNRPHPFVRYRFGVGRMRSAGEAPLRSLRKYALVPLLASLRRVRGFCVFGTASAAPPLDW